MTAATALPKVHEIDFQRQLVGYTKGRPTGIATILGWVHVHFRPAKTKFGFKTPGTGEMAAGWPDLVLVRERDRRLIFAELKSQDGRLRPEQRQVLDLLGSLIQERGSFRSDGSCAPSIEVYIWRPSDLEQIAEILR